MEKQDHQNKEQIINSDSNYILQWFVKFKTLYKIPFNIYQNQISELSHEIDDIQKEIDAKQKEIDDLKQRKNQVTSHVSSLKRNQSNLKKSCVKDMDTHLRKKNVKALVCEEYHLHDIILKIHTRNNTYTVAI